MNCRSRPGFSLQTHVGGIHFTSCKDNLTCFTPKHSMQHGGDIGLSCKLHWHSRTFWMLSSREPSGFNIPSNGMSRDTASDIVSWQRTSTQANDYYIPVAVPGKLTHKLRYTIKHLPTQTILPQKDRKLCPLHSIYSSQKSQTIINPPAASQ